MYDGEGVSWLMLSRPMDLEAFPQAFADRGHPVHQGEGCGSYQSPDLLPLLVDVRQARSHAPQGRRLAFWGDWPRSMHCLKTDSYRDEALHTAPASCIFCGTSHSLLL